MSNESMKHNIDHVYYRVKCSRNNLERTYIVSRVRNNAFDTFKKCQRKRYRLDRGKCCCFPFRLSLHCTILC